MDLDGDGIISMYEMEFFYEEQVEKMEMLGIETLPFQDCLCQVCFADVCLITSTVSVIASRYACVQIFRVHKN